MDNNYKDSYEIFFTKGKNHSSDLEFPFSGDTRTNSFKQHKKVNYEKGMRQYCFKRYIRKKW